MVFMLGRPTQKGLMRRLRRTFCNALSMRLCALVAVLGFVFRLRHNSCASDVLCYASCKYPKGAMARRNILTMSANPGTAQFESDSVSVSPAPGFGSATGHWWTWRGYRVRYTEEVQSRSARHPVLLVHGFGASADYFRKLSPRLAAAGYATYALDLLGLGLSEKPLDQEYRISLWAELVEDFCKHMFGADAPPILIGNSFGSLVAVTAASGEWGRQGGVHGLVMLNCAGGMNVKHMVNDDLTPAGLKIAACLVTKTLDFFLSWQCFAGWFFNQVRKPQTVRQVLRSIYAHPDAVDDELVASVLAPAEDPNALSVFVKILIGDPGTSPEKLMPHVTCPVILVWGDRDTFTPVNGAYRSYFQDLAKSRGDVSFNVVKAGHIPHDDNPDAVEGIVLPWLAQIDGSD